MDERSDGDPVVEVGPVAHGGSCVARLDGQVVFVRHALPGETVRLRITEWSKRFLRADAIEVLEASPDRVTPPCDLAGICGGCDFQHVAPEAQRRLLGEVVSEQLRRLAGIDRAVHVEAVEPILGWRTRVTWAVDEEGRPGLRRHRSHDVVPVRSCPIAHPSLPDVNAHRWTPGTTVETVVSSTSQTLVVTDDPVPRELPVDGVVATDGTRRRGTSHLAEQVADHRFRVSGSGFWQVHPAAARTLVHAVLGAAEVRPGETVADLYAGAGLFSAFLADATGPGGRVVSVEADRQASRDARRTFHDRPEVDIVCAPTERAVRGEALRAGADVVVLDPPRTGAKDAVADIARLAPRRLVYVACDPAALARDVASFAAHGYELGDLRAFALFPMTHHVECVAVLDRSADGSATRS